MKVVMTIDQDGVGVFRREAEMTLTIGGETFLTVVEREKDSGLWSVDTRKTYDGEFEPYSGGAYDASHTVSELLGQEIYAICNPDVVDFDLGEG